MDAALGLRALYPGATLVERGVVHVAAAIRHEGRLHVLAIGPYAPKSATDFFVLSATRARADAVLTTARILRDEPDLTLDFRDDLRLALNALRVDLGREKALVCAILTRDGDVPRDHSIFRDGSHKLVLTTSSAAARVRTSLGDRAEVIAVDDLRPETAIALLHARGHALVSVEAGPSTVAPLYASAAVVDELLLTTFEGELADARGLGPALPADHALFAGLVLKAESRMLEASGPFHFACWQRAI